MRTAEKPGKNITQKVGFRPRDPRHCTGAFLKLVCIKAQQAGCQVILLDPRSHRSSPDVPFARKHPKQSLCEREHRCSCGSWQPATKLQHDAG
jgi:putative transposase